MNVVQRIYSDIRNLVLLTLLSIYAIFYNDDRFFTRPIEEWITEMVRTAALTFLSTLLILQLFAFIGLPEPVLWLIILAVLCLNPMIKIHIARSNNDKTK